MNMKKYCTDISIKKKASECTELPITDRLQYYSLHRVGKLSENVNVVQNQ